MIDVWLIEDNATYRRNLARAVRRNESLCCGREFDSVEDALAALKKQPPPDVVLVDVALPGMDGIAGIPHLLERAQGASIVVLTAFDDADKIYRAICAGASGYLLKTATIDEVARAVRQAAEGGAPMTPSVARRVLKRFSEIAPQPRTEDTHIRNIYRQAARQYKYRCRGKGGARTVGVTAHDHVTPISLPPRTIVRLLRGTENDMLLYVRQWSRLVKHPVIQLPVGDCSMVGEKGVRTLLPERPEGCFAQKGPDPFFPVRNQTS